MSSAGAPPAPSGLNKKVKRSYAQQVCISAKRGWAPTLYVKGGRPAPIYLGTREAGRRLAFRLKAVSLPAKKEFWRNSGGIPSEFLLNS
jgi:hypothetical protein